MICKLEFCYLASFKLPVYLIFDVLMFPEGAWVFGAVFACVFSFVLSCVLSGFLSGVLSGFLSGVLSVALSCVLSYVTSCVLARVLARVLCVPARLQALVLPVRASSVLSDMRRR